MVVAARIAALAALALALAACKFDSGGVPFDEDGGGSIDGGPIADAGADAPPGTLFTLTVALSGSGLGTVASSPAGIDCGTTCEASFPAGAQVTLTASSTGQSAFSGWLGACTGVQPSCTVNMTNSQAVSAVFEAGGGTLSAFVFGDSEDDEGLAIAAHPSGGWAAAGSVRKATDLGGGATTDFGSADVFAGRWNASGVPAWARRMGESGGEVATSVVTAADGDVIVGGFWQGVMDFGGGNAQWKGNHDGFVARYSAADGGFEWLRTIGGPGTEVVHALAIDGAGNVLVAGYFESTADYGTGSLTALGGQDVFVLKLDGSSGAVMWARSFGSLARDEARGIAATSAGTVYAVGFFDEPIDFGGGSRNSAGKSDIFVLALDASGDYVWDQTFGGAESDQAHAVAVTSVGEPVVVGQYNGAISVGGANLPGGSMLQGFVAKYSATGGHVWSRGFGGMGNDIARGVAIGTGNAVIVVGHIASMTDLGGGALPTAGMQDGFAARYSSGGVYQWARALGGSKADTAAAVAVDVAAGAVLVTGTTDGPADFGTGPLDGAGKKEIFFLRLRL